MFFAIFSHSKAKNRGRSEVGYGTGILYLRVFKLYLTKRLKRNISSGWYCNLSNKSMKLAWFGFIVNSKVPSSTQCFTNLFLVWSHTRNRVDTNQAVYNEWIFKIAIPNTPLSMRFVSVDRRPSLLITNWKQQCLNFIRNRSMISDCANWMNSVSYCLFRHRQRHAESTHFSSSETV